MLQIRERPPLRLSINVETPGGAHARWGADDLDPANKPDGLSFGTSIPGGFADMSCTLARDPRRDWPDTEELSDVKVRDPGGEIAWEGRLEKLPDTGGSQSQLNPQAVGYQSALDDDSSAAVIYVDQGLSNWQGPSLNRQKNLLAGNFQPNGPSTVVDPADNLPSLALEIDGAWASPNLPICEAWYDAGAAGLISVVFAVFDFNQNGDGNWRDVMSFSGDDAFGTGLQQAVLTLAGATTEVFSATTPRRYTTLSHWYNNTPAGTDGQQYIAYVRPAVIGNNPGVTIQGGWPTPGIGVLASDVIAHALAKWAPEINFTTGVGGTIQPSGYAIPQLTFLTPGTSSAIIKQAVAYELLDWAIWEGPTFYLNERGESAKARNWRARVGPAQLQETGPDASRLCNGVVVQYTNTDGTTGTVGPPGSGAQTESSLLLDTDPANPANQDGRRHWPPLQLSTTTPDGAIQAGQIFLRVQSITDTSGQASLVGYVQDDKGIWWPAWEARAGDTITFTDARNTNPRRIVSTSYAHSSKTNTLQLDQPPDIMSALLAEMSEQVAPFGLS